MENSERHSQYESPLRYPGGKACIYPFVTNLFRENNLIGSNYAEPYAGGAGLALKLLYNEYVDQIYINDLDRSIYCFWKIVLSENVRFCDWVENVEVDIDAWVYYRDIQKNVGIFSEFEIAKSTF